MLLLYVGSILLLCFRINAQTVFAHFMLGNTENYGYSDYEDDITKAQEAHIDGFALNMAYDEDTTEDGLLVMFAVAESKGFKLIFSFDYAGNGPWPKEDVIDLINSHKSSSAYFWHHGEKPLVSTFEGPDQAKDWPEIKQQTGCFFMPSWSSLGAKKAMLKENGVADGLFSWGAWAEGDAAMNTKIDASYKDFLNGRPYMMPVSPWFYTSRDVAIAALQWLTLADLPGYDKNWLWRGDNTWWDRWIQVWYFKCGLAMV